jgi:hypothetical protein
MDFNVYPRITSLQTRRKNDTEPHIFQTQIMTSSSTKPAKFYHRDAQSYTQSCTKENIKKNQDGFSLRFFKSK